LSLRLGGIQASSDQTWSRFEKHEEAGSPSGF
jgi:hypothetical protein